VKLIAACWLNDEAMVRSLRTKHPNIADNLTDVDRRQVARAARNNETNAVRLLLESGLPADAGSQHQAMPLHWAAFHGNVGMAKLLLAQNPLLETKDADFHSTPLGWAIHGSENGWHCQTGDYAATAEALIAAGASRESKSMN
jgi:ankyrin repeat protein